MKKIPSPINPDISEHVPGKNSQKYFEVLKETAKRVNRYNAVDLLENMQGRKQSIILRKIYVIFKDELYSNYNAEGVLSEMSRYCGKSIRSLKRKIYTRKRKNIHKRK